MSYPKNKHERFLIGKRKGKKRSDLFWNDYSWFNVPDREERIERNRQSRRDTTKLCSCVMCGNPRKYFGERTLQEKKFFESNYAE